VIIGIPQEAVANLTPNLFADAPADSVVVDTGNYFPVTRDGATPDIDAGLLDSEWTRARFESWRFQRGTQGYCRDYDTVRLRRHSAR
jgi:hypothetical protein